MGMQSKSIPEVCPLTASQLGVHMECVNDPQTIKYNIPILNRLPKGVDAPRFIAAAKKVIDNHPAFHVCIDEVKGVPSMIYKKDLKLDVIEKTVESLDEECHAFRRPFDFANGPLCDFEYVHSPQGDAFLYDVHHIIYDGTSVNILIHQIIDVYNGKEIEEEEFTLFDQSISDQMEKDPQTVEKYRTYFEEKLGGIDCDSKPVSDQVLPNTEHVTGYIQELASASLKIEDVEEYVKKNGISENAFFMGVFAYTLAKFNGTNECFFTAANTGRGNKSYANTIGFFVKSLPYACRFNEDIKPADFLKEVYNDYYFLKKNDVISYTELANQYGFAMDISFVYQSRIMDEVLIEGKPCTISIRDEDCAVSPLELMVLKSDAGYEYISHYFQSEYSEELMQSFIRLYTNVALGMLKEKRLGDICLVDETVKTQIAKFNETECDYEDKKTVVELFCEQAKANPDALCLVYKDKKYTYKEVDEITDRLASHLCKIGLGKGTYTGILIPRCEYMLICAMAVLKSGGAYMPLDPTYPPERLNLMMKDSEAKMLLTTPELTSIIDESYEGERFLVDDIWNLPETTEKLSYPALEDPFVLLYTSGSTGVPKGVIFAHSNTMVTAAWERRFFEFDASCNVTAYASFGFDANVFDMYATVTSGATLYIIADDIRLDLIALKKYYDDNGITHTTMTTQVGRQFALMGEFKTLRYINVGGEKITPFTPPKNTKFCNAYGPTEGSILATAFVIDTLYRDVPIGKPVDNVKMFVVDPEGRMLPPGATGELWITGAHVTKGYLNRPEKTAEVYVQNPFCEDKGYEKAYRTGDIARYMCDGNIQFIGRRDGQVKVRGFRVELTEIEEVVRRFDGIKDATVAAFDDPAGGKFIAAYVVADSPVDVEAMNAFIRSEKPPYMVPAVTMQIDKIPFTQNQKVNKRALPKPERKAENLTKPENEMQETILNIIADVVGHHDLGVDTNIFDAGLTSIGTLKLNVSLGKEFDVAFKIDDLKQNDTIRKLEALILSSSKAETYALQEDYPITQTQQGIFIECSSNLGATTYNIPVLMKLSDKVDIEKLQKAIKTVLNAHPYTKTTLFPNENGDIRARRNDDVEPIVEIVSESHLPSDNNLVRPFTLINGPLYRVHIYDTPEGKYLFMDFHHIISDGTSEAILLSDIDKVYAGQSIETEKFTGFDVALDEEKARSSERYDRAKAYYDSVFAGCDPTSLPPKSPEAENASSASITSVCGTSVDTIKAYCEKHQLSLNAFFNTAFGYTLRNFGAFDDVIFTTIYNGRSDSRLASTISMMVKTLPVLIHTEKDDAIVNLIRATQEQLLNSMINDIYSFAEISGAYGIKSDVIFAYQGDNFNFNTLCGEPAEVVVITPNTSKAPLAINVNLVNGQFEFLADYRKDVFGKPFIHAFLDALNQVVNGFIGKERLSQVSLLSSEAEHALASMNDTAYDYEKMPIACYFEKWAKEKPDTVAVICQDRKLTFDELNRKANRIAYGLHALGIQKDAVVGMVLERDITVPLTEIAILKAGGAFLGMLPSYPDERIEYCLQDAESPVVITTKDILAQKPELFAEDKPYKTVTLEDLLQNEWEENLNLDIPMDSLAYCIYTSGSTGKPKGVMIEQRNLACLANVNKGAYRYYHGVEGATVGLAFSSISFDMSIFDDLLFLITGKSTVIATEEEIHNPSAMANVLLKNHVDTMATTPSILTNYLSIPEFSQAIAQLRTVVCGAEAFQPVLFDKLKELSPNIHILNGYGPSECTITCCAKELTNNRNITIGGPVENNQFYVVDHFGNILPPYAVGELIICGDMVGRGYVKLPEKTAASFFTLKNMPAYHSGDTVRLNQAGEVEFFGRIDNQVKLRGFRVELDEIENVLCTFEGIQQSKVIVRNNGSEDYLVGFFTAEKEIDLSQLTEFLKSKLTYYMVPDVMAQLDAMPLTANGKIDKKALPEVKRESRKANRKKAPKKSLEEQICELFKSILSLDEFYADDSFFEMGGTSLSASKVIMQLMSKGIKVEYQDIFDNPTPEELADYIESTMRKAAKEEGKENSTEGSSEIDEILKHNTLEFANEVEREPIGDVLLTGAVGFLGIHILKELVERKEGKVFCLVRKGHFSSPEVRLKNMLVYYFEKDYAEEIENGQIVIVNADITDDSLVEDLNDISFDTLINCAACVKHYAADDLIERVNVHGVENLLKVAKAKNAKMIQISTTSVPGVHTADTYKRQVKMHENELFVVDDMDNKYCISKYHAELKVFEAIKEGMRAKVIRVGNLMGRHSDGEFQINFESNAFLNALRGFATIGKCPISHATDPMSFSPIELTARAIVLLAGTNDMFTAFHADSRFGFDEMQLIEATNHCGISITPVPDKEYYDDYYRMLGDEQVNGRLQGLVTNDRPDLHMVDTDNVFTANVLYRLGFSWPLVDGAYLERAINSLDTLGYFE